MPIETEPEGERIEGDRYREGDRRNGEQRLYPEKQAQTEGDTERKTRGHTETHTHTGTLPITRMIVEPNAVPLQVVKPCRGRWLGQHLFVCVSAN